MISLLLFELRRNLRQAYLRVFFLVLMLPGVVFLSGLQGRLGQDEPANTPTGIFLVTLTATMLAMLGVGGVMARAVHQDFACRIHPLLFATPVSNAGYLLGRYLGALLALLGVLPAISLGAWLGTLAPWSELLYVPNRLEVYLWPLLVISMPNCVLLGTLCFSVAALTRRMLPVYVVNLLLALGVIVASAMVDVNTAHEWQGLADPTGLAAYGLLSKSLGRTGQELSAVPLQGVLLANRLLWLGVSGAVVALTLVLFRRTSALDLGGSSTQETSAPPRHRVPPPATQDFHTLTWLRLLPRLSTLELRTLVRTPAFVVLCLAAAAAITIPVSMVGREMGAPSQPVTYLVLERALKVLLPYSLLVLGFFSSELVWRDREQGAHLLMDSLPAPTWVAWLSRLVALWATQVPLTLVVGACCALVQLARGYTQLEPRLYAVELGLHLVDMAPVAVLVLLLYTAVQSRPVGHLLLAAYVLVRVWGPSLGLELHMLLYGASPPHVYSDMNGYGPFVSQMVAFRVYWVLVAVVLAFGIHLLWARGTELHGRTRLRQARALFTPAVRAGLAVCLLGAGLAAGFLLYNTHSLHRYLSAEGLQAEQAEYERRYKPWAERPQPALTSVRLQVDLYPGQSRVEVRGTYGLLNRHTEPVREVLVTLPPEVEVRRLALGGAQAPAEAEARFGAYTLQLPQPLAPGERAELQFELVRAERGFPQGRPWTSVAENGTFLRGDEVLPELGYDRGRELASPEARKRQGLPERTPPLEPEDPRARTRQPSEPLLFSVDFEVTLSTSADQVALAPGDLQREWTEGGRRLFHYVLKDSPVPQYIFTSGRYQVHREAWKDIAIEIYHHPTHAYNVQRMAAAVRDSLEYYTSAFGPYPYRQVRIVEFPRYEPLALSLPNTIPFAESLGFIARVDPLDPEDLDYPYYITAHELAHQWWGQQVRPGQALGVRFITEALSQYSALMVVKRHRGERQVGRLLRLERQRYLFGRAGESQEEPPLWRVEGQSHVYYHKGAIALYNLQAHVGEEALNRALAAFREQYAYQQESMPTSKDLLEHLRATTPPALQPLFHETFERVVLYDLSAERATAAKVRKGVWQVNLKVRVAKKERVGKAEERQLPVDDQVEVAVLDEKGNVLYLKPHHFTQAETELSVEVERRPAQAGLDPYNKLVALGLREALTRVEER